jgi:hypothetical protein
MAGHSKGDTRAYEAECIIRMYQENQASQARVEPAPVWKRQEDKSARESGACSRARDLGPTPRTSLGSRTHSFRHAPSALLRCPASRRTPVPE